MCSHTTGFKKNEGALPLSKDWGTYSMLTFVDICIASIADVWVQEVISIGYKLEFQSQLPPWFMSFNLLGSPCRLAAFYGTAWVFWDRGSLLKSCSRTFPGVLRQPI